MKGRLVLTALVTSAVAAGGCFLVTGSTSGYTQEPSSSEGGCEGAADCTGDGGAQICCFISTSLSSTCQGAPCGAGNVQLCAKSAECTDAACTSQSCSIEGTSYEVRACGAISGCTP
jgi:hypothetical protein